MQSDFAGVDVLYISIFLVLAISVGIIFFFVQTLQTLQQLIQRNHLAWEQLTALLADRHLVISHLIDSVSWADPQAATRDLVNARERAEIRLNEFRDSPPIPVGADVLGESERRLSESLDSALDFIGSHDSLHLSESVLGCQRGLDKLEKEIQAASEAYNFAAITFTTFANSGRGSLVARSRKLPTSFCQVDWHGAKSSLRASTSGDTGDDSGF